MVKAARPSRAEAIQTAHANIDSLLSKKNTYNDVFPEEVFTIAKQFFERVYDAGGEIFRHTSPRPKPAIIIAAVIHAACRQCDGQPRTFNEMARLTGQKVGQIEKFYFLIDTWFFSMDDLEVKQEVNNNGSEVKKEVKEGVGVNKGVKEGVGVNKEAKEAKEGVEVKMKEEVEVKMEKKEEGVEKGLPTPYKKGARASASDLAARWSANLGLGSKAIKLASDLAGRTEEWSSRSPANIAGGAIYAVSELMATTTYLSFKEISNVSCAPAKSLEGAYKEMNAQKERYMPVQWLELNGLKMA